MGAIFGLMDLVGGGIAPTDLARMGAKLARHGGDGTGQWSDGVAALGNHMRCFTPEDEFERQPLVDPHLGCVMVWDGRIDNRPDLAAQLSLNDARTLADSALAMAAFLKWDTACVKHLVGAFAFAVWEPARGRLFVARSAIVAPTLYFHRSDRQFAFATLPSALSELPGIPRSINERKLADMLIASPADPMASWFAGIERLPTGTWMTVERDGKSAIHAYWAPDTTHTLHLAGDDEYLDAFREILDRVVQAQLRCRRGVGAMMSGGLDSTAIAATAASLLARQDGRLTCYTAVWSPQATPLPRGCYVDEVPIVQAVARRYTNLDQRLVTTAGVSFLDDLDASFADQDRYFSNVFHRSWIEAILAAAHDEGIDVMLSGVQGNLTFSRDGGDLVAQRLHERDWRALGAHILDSARRRTWRSLAASGIPCLPAPLRELVERITKRSQAHSIDYVLSNSPIHPDFARRHRVAERALAADPHFCAWRMRRQRQEHLLGLQRQDIGIFDTGFRARFGVDVRAPAADVRIAEFALALPDDQLTYRGQRRALVRRAFRNDLPSEVTSNASRGYQVADWFDRMSAERQRLRAELDVLKRNDLAQRALDLDRMQRMIEDWPPPGAGLERIAEYMAVLARGIVIGRFIAWVADHD